MAEICMEAAEAIGGLYGGTNNQRWAPRYCHVFGGSNVRFNMFSGTPDPAHWRRPLCQRAQARCYTSATIGKYCDNRQVLQMIQGVSEASCQAECDAMPTCTGFE